MAMIKTIAKDVTNEYGFDYAITYVITVLTVMRLSNEWLKLVALKEYLSGASPATIEGKYGVSRTVLRGVYQRLRDMFSMLPPAARDDFLRFVVNRAFRAVWEAGPLVIGDNKCVECGIFYESPRSHVLRHHSKFVKESVVKIMRLSGLSKIKLE